VNIGVVVAQGFWMHFHDVFKELRESHQVSVFHQRRVPFQLMSERINRRLLDHDLSSFMRSNDVVFFEWSEHVFVRATNLPKSCRIITRLHLHELWDFAPYANWQNVDAVIFVSNTMERRFLEYFPNMAGRTRVVHNGVSLEKFSYSAHPFRRVIGTLGRIEPHKRIYDLIITLHDLRRQGYDLTLNIGGRCTEERYRRYDYEVHSLVDRLQLTDYVHFQGQVTDTPAWFKQVDIFVSNSCSEGLQVALLEAMASGCYCLSHLWGGASEVLPPENLYVTESELQERIKAYCVASSSQKDAECAKMRSIAEQCFDIDVQKMKIKQIIEETVYHGS